MPRFVVLTHDHPFLHWDFMLEKEASLRSWRLLEPPCSDHPIAAECLPDHRLAYLDYEGPVSGNRGTVITFDRGEYTFVEETTHSVVAELKGIKLEGTVTIRPVAENEVGRSEFIFKRNPQIDGRPGQFP
jgi:hypothetical protein